MSELDTMEPATTSKDPSLVNGSAGDIHDDIPPPQEPQSTKQPVEPVNGIEHNGVEEDSIPVNGDIQQDNEVIMDHEDLEQEGGSEGDIILPPPPEDMSAFPPSLQQDVDIVEPEPSIEQDPNSGENEIAEGDMIGTSVDTKIAEGDLGTSVDSKIEEGDMMGTSVDSIPQVDSIGVQKVVEDVSEEELVSDEGVNDEVELEHPISHEPVVMEQPQLIDLGGEQEMAGDVQATDNNILDSPVPDESQTGLAHEIAPEPVVVASEPVVQELVAPDDHMAAEKEPEPQPVVQIPEQPAKGQEPVCEEPPLREPEPEAVDEKISEPVMEPVGEISASRPPGEITEVRDEIKEEVSQDVYEPEPEAVKDVENDYVKSEPVVEQPPDIIAQTTEEPHEVQETPPPPPPPLVEETPPPPPPLDESIQLKRDSRRSGEVTPKKESPVEPSVAHAPEPTPVAVVAPVMKAEEKEEPPSPTPAPEPKVVPPVTAIEDNDKERTEGGEGQGSVPISPVSSPARSEAAGSEGALSEPQDIASPQVSQKINKKNFKNKIKFHVDLVEASLKQLSFLNIVNKQTSLLEEWLYKQAIRRYEAFWLPLAVEHKKEHLAAPLDIEWVWHCHMLAPACYEADCTSLVGKVVDHKLYSEKERTKALEKSRKYWTAKYPNEPFEIELVYKEKSEEPVVAGQESEVKEDSIPYVEEGTSEVESKGNQEEEVTADGGEVTDKTEADQKSAEPGTTEDAQKEGDTQEDQPKPDAEPKPAEETAKVEPEPVVPAVPPAEEYIQKSSYDIFSAIGRQRVFFYQVSLPHYHDKLFLKSAVKRYQKLLFVKHQNPTELLVPCYDIDLIWHSHQLHPLSYKKDTTKILGQMLCHNDSVNDRTPGSKLLRADSKTRELWKTLFEDTFASFGAMFRGDPPALCERMSLIQPEETYAFSTKKATINLDKFQIEGLPEAVNKYNVKVVYGASEKEGPLIKSLKGNKKKVEFENAKKGLAHFVFDTKEYDRLKFNMSRQDGFACTFHDEDIGEQMFNLLPVVESIPMDKQDASALTDTVTIDEEQNLKATFSATVETPKQGPTMLFLKNGNYETRFCIMPEHVVQMWGPIPLPRLPAGKDNACMVASHKFVNHTGEVTFTCRLIHSLPLVMSAIQVFYHDRMAAVAHLIGSDQLPVPEQISDNKKHFSLNAKEEQRGIVIKNRTGDWGLIRGQWTGYRKGSPAIPASKGKKAKKAVPWCPGTLSVSFYKLSTGAWQHLSLNYLQNDYKFNIQESNVDLKTGVIQVDSSSNEVAENLALAFSVALLHVLCQPRPKPAPPQVAPKPSVPKTPPPEEPKQVEAGEGEGIPAPAPGPTPAPEEGPEVAEGEKEKETEETPKSPAKPKEVPATPKKVAEIPPIPSADLSLVLAAGYKVETPTNQYIKKAHGANACAGCVAYGADVGIGILGDVSAEVEPEVEIAETAENTAENVAENVAETAGEVEGAEGGEEEMEMEDAGDMGGDAWGDGGGDAAGCAGCAG